MKRMGARWTGLRPALVLLALAGAAPRAQAHRGPPYPIVVDRVTGHGTLSVWADPDVGTGTFWITLEPSADGGAPAEDSAVQVYVQPLDRSAPALGRPATLTRQSPGDRRFEVEVPFASLGPWWVRFDLSGSRGTESVEQRVEVTPPGQGPVLDFILYLFPFAAVGFLFILAMIRRGRAGRPPQGAP